MVGGVKRFAASIIDFGPWFDPDTALQKCLDQKDDLFAGRTPRVSGDGLTVAELCYQFLAERAAFDESVASVKQLINNVQMKWRTE